MVVEPLFQSKKMIIASWNINSVRIREESLLYFIKKLNPDILLLQEIKCEEKFFPYNFFDQLDYQCFVNGQKSRNGVAIVAKKSLDLFEDKNYENLNIDSQSRFIIIYSKFHNVYFSNLYMPNGNPTSNLDKFNLKLNWLNNLKNFIIQILEDEKKLIIGGDFNVIENPRDVKNFEQWKEDALGHNKVIEEFREILGLGMQNVVRKFFKPGEKYSFWDYQKSSWEKNDGLLIDHFLVTPNLIDQTIKFDIDTNPRGLFKPSDHAPIWMEIN